jgi:hypothetical protein
MRAENGSGEGKVDIYGTLFRNTNPDSLSLEASEKVIAQRSFALGEEVVSQQAQSHVDDDREQHDNGAEGDGAGLGGVVRVHDIPKADGGGNLEKGVAT